MEKTKNYNKIIDKRNYGLNLYKVVYKTVEVPENATNKTVFKLKTRDSYKILNITENNIEVEYKREQYFEPKAMLEIEIIIRMIYEIKKKKKEENILKIIEEQFKKDIGDYLRPAAVHSSIIISTLTNVNLKVPILGPPFPVFDEEGNED